MVKGKSNFFFVFFFLILIMCLNEKLIYAEENFHKYKDNHTFLELNNKVEYILKNNNNEIHKFDTKKNQ